MDISHLLELRIAPYAVFAQLETRKDTVRFMVPASGTSDWRPVTWGAFADEIREIGMFLGTILKPGDRSAIYAPNTVTWGAAALAIQAASGVMVPIYPASTVDQIGYVASHSDAKVIFVDTPALVGRLISAWQHLGTVEKVVLMDASLDLARVHESLVKKGDTVPALAEIQKRVITIAEARKIGHAENAAKPGAFETKMNGVDLDQPGLMLYTSGTSGNPKGVPLTHRNVGVNGRDWLTTNAPLLKENGVDVLWLPMSHIFGLGELCLGNSLGWTTYLSDPMTCLTRLPEIKPTIFMSVPSHWEKLSIMAMHEATPEARLAKFTQVTGGRLQYCLSGGAGLKREVKDFFFACGVLLVEGYGLTETSPTLTLNRADAFRFDTVGKPVPSVELRLAEDGEILARGESVFKGYHKDPVATKEAFTDDGWFKTGDVGQFTDDGFLKIVDRKKDILVTAGGKNVPPANIEIRFRDDVNIAHVVVYGEAKKFLVAGVWLNEDTVKDLSTDERRSLVQKRVDAVNADLASYETIKKFTIIAEPLSVENELLTSSMKIRRKKINERFKGLFEALYDEPKPKTELRA